MAAVLDTAVRRWQPDVHARFAQQTRLTVIVSTPQWDKSLLY
jgi:hypothetical protein